MRVALVTNIPAPYRVPVYDELALRLGDGFRVVYLAATEANRQWKPTQLRHAHRFLRGVAVPGPRGDIHLRIGMTRELSTFRPDVVLTGGFQPAMLVAWMYALAARLPHVVLSDGWRGSELGLSRAHRLVRRAVFATSRAFVGASARTLELFADYGIERDVFRAPLAVDNAQFARAADASATRPYDLVFSGRIAEGKQPLFFAEVARRLCARRGSLAVLVIGDGPLREALQAALVSPGLHATFAGFVQPQALPAEYARGKILCFPTTGDAWGIVANEACAAGLPVVTCANAGCAGELVVNGVSGLVLPLHADAWAAQLERFLADPELLARTSERARVAVADYTFTRAANAIVEACTAATRRPSAGAAAQNARDR